ncbi:hypothetical protein EON65_38635 [archaeon]|nr:MAG: hypothetical protein EON65_38635 [archaeon]
MERRQYQLHLKEYVASIRSVYGQHDELGQEAAKTHSLKHRKDSKCHSTNEDTASLIPSDASLTYGEVTATDFMNILSTVERLMVSYGSTGGNEKMFVDLGCGRGLPCACAAISTLNFANVWGIEIVPELIVIANKLRDVFISTFSSPTPSSTPIPKSAKLSSKTSKPVKSDRTLIEHVQMYMLENTNEGEYMSLETLADVLCKQLGHKRYRLLKGSKTLRKCLQSHVDIVKLIGEDQYVELVDRSVPNKTEDNSSKVDSGALPTIGPVTPPVTALIILPPHQIPLPTMAFDCGDIFAIPWWESADVAYVASLLFSEDMMLLLTSCVVRMKPQSWVLSLRPLPDLPDSVVLRHDSFFKMSWQMAKVYFYQVI